MSIDFADEIEEHLTLGGGGHDFQTVWGRIYQKKSTHTKKQSRRSKRGGRYAQLSDVSTHKADNTDLYECMALQLCTTTKG